MVAGAKLGYRQVTAAGVSLVSISASAQAVQVKTRPGRVITVRWSSYGAPQATLSMVRAGSSEQIWFHPPVAVSWSWSLFRRPTAVLDISLPPGLSLNSTVRSGSVRVTGSYRRLSATVESGTIDLVQVTADALRAQIGYGALGAEGATVGGPLVLTARVGAIDFWGNPGPDALISDSLGGINLKIDPTARLAVTVRKGLGSFTTVGFPLLRGGQNSGVYTGIIGQGAAGSLTVTANLGSVTISPYRP